MRARFFLVWRTDIAVVAQVFDPLWSVGFARARRKRLIA